MAMCAGYFEVSIQSILTQRIEGRVHNSNWYFVSDLQHTN